MLGSRRSQILIGTFLLLAIRFLAILVIPPSGDEVAHLYIADDIAHFIQFPIYFYRQAVMGALESYFLAPFVRLFGFSLWGARAYYGLFYLSFVALYLWIAKHLFRGGLTTSLFILLSILPFPALFFTTSIGWSEIPMFAILSLFFLVKIAEGTPGKSLGLSGGLGVVCGLALWCNPLFILWLVPVGMSLIWLIPMKRKLKTCLVFLLGFFIGLFPVWIHGLQTGVLMDLKGHGGKGFISPQNLPQIVYLFLARMKYFLSTFSFGSVSPLVDGLIRTLSWIPFSIFLIAYVSLTFHFLRTFLRQGSKEKVFYSFMILPPLLLMVLYCSRNFTGQDEGMRFFVQLLIPYVFAVAWWLEGLGSRLWKKGFLSLLVGIGLLGSFYSGREVFQRGKPFGELIQFLEKEGLRFGIADIGTAYPLNILSQHRILLTPLPHHVVSDSIWKRVKEEGPRFLILERRNPQLRGELERDVNLKKASVGDYDIFYGKSDYLASLLDVEAPILG